MVVCVSLLSYVHIWLSVIKILTQWLSSDNSISGFQFRYYIDMILTKYRDIDIDTISIFCKCVRYAC